MIRVDQRDFSEALEAARLARGKTITVLEQAHVRSKDGTLEVTCTDLDLRIVKSVRATGDGEFLLPAVKLAKVVKPRGPKKSPRQIVFGVEDEKPVVLIDGARVKLPQHATLEDWPVGVKRKWKTCGEYNTAEVVRALKYCIPAISTDETRPYIMRAHFYGSRILATDGHRFHLVHLGGDDHPVAPLARQAAILLAKLCRDETFVLSHCEAEDDMGRCRVEWVNSVLVCDNPVGAQLPPFDDLLKGERAKRGVTFHFNRADLLARLAKAKAMLDKDADAILRYTPGEMDLKIEALEQGIDATTVEWDHQHEGIEDNRMKFVPDERPRDVSDEEWAEQDHAEPKSSHYAQPTAVRVSLSYFVDALADGADVVEVKVADETSPLYMRSGDFESLVIPIRL